MLRHTLTHALEDLRHRVSAGSPSLTVALRYVQLSDRARVEWVNWVEAKKAVSHCEGPRSAGGLGLKAWEDVGGLTQLE
ncbi:hypothetical protein [Myxococcus sp. AB056]|uniref:hypothetical protein n=1 Tax=Myxococcus sp. AB056 TaxID=2562792 RepID=UPI0011461F81|nr:hypothetical protein [Myxococcus sp. AB056]